VLNQPDKTVKDASNSIRELKNSINLFKFDNRIQSDLEALILFVWEVIKIVLLIEPLTVFDLLKKLDKKRADIQTLYEYIGKFDSAISTATFRREMPYFCKPVITGTVNSLGFTDIYHPLIPNCVSNSLQTNGQSILLTGSNMSGKTTFIRTVAINILFAQTINTCFAKDFRLAQMRLFSAVRITDDLLNAVSYYFEEVLIIKELLKESDSSSNNIFFLDEIFKGTNTVERIAAGKAVLSYLARLNNNIVFVSTHDIELTDLLSDEYDLYHFTENIQEQQIHFDYKLKPGNLTTTNAIRILEINDYPEEVTNEARKISFSGIKS
jgi:DNA mismatch repair ATPase MutS